MRAGVLVKTVAALLALCVALLCAGCDLLAPRQPEVSPGPTPLPPVPWTFPSEEDMLSQLSAEMTALSGFSSDETALLSAAAAWLKAPGYHDVIDTATRSYASQTAVFIDAPDISAQAAAYVVPDFAGVPSRAAAYLADALSAYDHMAAGLLGGSGSAFASVSAGSIRVGLTRASEEAYTLSFTEENLRAMAWAIIDAVRVPFREQTALNDDYQMARAVQVLSETYPIAYALREAVTANPALEEAWFRPDRMKDYLEHVRIVRFEYEPGEESDAFILHVMLPEPQAYIAMGRNAAELQLTTYDVMAPAPDIEAIFVDALGRAASEQCSYAGQVYELVVIRRHAEVPERDAPVEEWMEGLDEPVMNAVCGFSTELLDALYALMDGEKQACAGITDAERDKRYTAWNLPATGELTAIAADKTAPLVIKTKGVFGYLVRVTPIVEAKVPIHHFFVRGGDTFWGYLPEGEYRVDYTIGEQWLGKELEFGDAGRIYGFPDGQLLRYEEPNNGFVLMLERGPGD